MKHSNSSPSVPAITDEFKGAGAKEGLEIWRIEKLRPVPVDRSQYGKFYTGDSYIVLNTFKNAEGQRKYDTHFWLGTETTQDEAGTAALKTIELDDKLGGIPVQHREVQLHESNLFLSYFKGGIEYLEGGIDSGFNHVENTHKKRLLHLKGKRNVRVREVPISASSLNKGDVFVLDLGLTLIQFNGPEASKMEKAKGLEVTSNINSNERGAKATIHIIEYPKDNDKPETKQFWEELGGEGEVAPASAGGDDTEYEKAVAATVQLLRVSDSTGELVVTPVASVPLKKTQLDTNDCFIVDVGTQIFVWVGKGSTQQEKTSSMQLATGFLASSGRPEWTPITRVVEGGEPPAFKSQFSNWSDVTLNRPRLEKKATPSQTKIDVGLMHTGSQKQIDASAVRTIKHRGGGELTVWRVENFKLADLPKDQYGLFYSGDSYVVQYTERRQGGDDLHYVYFWQGRTSTADEKGASALLAKELDDKLHGTATQIRVVQNKEPNHFVSLFDGKLIIKQGGHPSGFKTVAQETAPSSDSPVQLYQIRGATEITTRAIEVPPKSASLSSRDAFILITQTGVTVWFGTGCDEEEKKQAKQVAARLAGGKPVTEVNEGSETSEFWNALGGKNDYEAGSHDIAKEPRLFWGSNATGLFKVEEIFDFTQDDLDEDDVYILDLYNEVYVWVGSGANDVEKKMAMETAIDFVTNAPDGRSPDTPIYRINAGAEPHIFTQNFVAWDATERDVYKRKMRQLQIKQQGATASTPVEVRKEIQETQAAPAQGTYTFAELSAKEKPKGVDPNALEKYLSDEEFQKILGVTRDQFEAFPGWKKIDIKKKKKLF
eukprot:Phypoly_transcript_02071.p1 GENE.Phypoly_transcript_02071~~Phypoly_transcript_02071.p1  ORF type:complete len:829 (+),score=189.83 Phypoly_transcript_02071:487-2973(+)